VQPIEGKRLRCGEPAPAGPGAIRVRAVVGEDAVKERGSPLRRQPAGRRADDLRPEGEMSEQSPLLADLEVGSVAELTHLADVGQQGGGQQQIRVEAGMKLAAVADQRPDRNRVLEQPAEIRVMASPGAGRAPELARDGLREEDSLDDLAELLIVDLTSQVL